MKKEWSYWIAENTGWSGGVSWFKTGHNEVRYPNKEEATQAARKHKKYMGDPSIQHRVTHRTVIEEYFEV